MRDIERPRSRRRGVRASRAKLHKAMADEGLKTQGALADRIAELEGLDVAGVSIPSREVGGDLFYWFTHPDGSLGESSRC